jgi:hypothetical protein
LSTYRATYVPDAETREEFARLERALNEAQPSFTFVVLHEEPARVFAGMVVVADGSDWQPDGVNGEGMYRRDSANSAWVFIG